MAISGTEGSVLLNGRLVPADKYVFDLQEGTPDRANFMTQGEPLNSRGQRTGEITLSGPYEGTLLVERGQLVACGGGITAELFVWVTMRVSGFRIEDDAKDGPRWQITGKQYGAANMGTAAGPGTGGLSAF